MKQTPVKTIPVKPSKKTLSYYDWDEVKSYMIKNKIWTSRFADNVWADLCDTKDIHNGTPFIINDWELKHNNGEFSYLSSKRQKKMITDVLNHFGSPDDESNTPNILTATFIAIW